MFVRDLALRSQLTEACRKAGFEVGGPEAEIGIVHLMDESCIRAFEKSPTPKTIGFYPHVRDDLARRAAELGIDAYQQRVFLTDPRSVLDTL